MFLFAAAAVVLAASPVTAWQSVGEPKPMNVRLTFQIIGANGPAADEPEIRAVVTELRKLFRFDGYHLLASSILHATAWPPSTVEQHVADDRGRQYSIGAEVQSNGPGIRLEVRLNDRNGSLINAAVNLENGKTVVLGTATVRSARAGFGGDASHGAFSVYADHPWRRAFTARSRDSWTDDFLRFAALTGSPSDRMNRRVDSSVSWIRGQTEDNAAIILVVTPTINP